MRTLVLALLLVSAAATPARALDPKSLEYLVEMGHGVTFPLGGDSYKRLADPSYEAQLRFALGIPIVAGLRLGPFVQLTGSPVNSDDASFENLGLDASFGRLRFLLGPDIRYRVIERLDLFLRVGFGVDYVNGNVRVRALGNLSGSYSSTVFGFEPAVGANVRVWRSLVLGLAFAFPFAVNHNFGTAGGARFNVADFDLTMLAGWRF